MSKEYLEAFKAVYNNFDYLISDIGIEDDEANICLMTIKEQLPIIKQALKRLESIENANPSEALECLEYIENKLHGLRVECERIKNHRCDDVFIQEHTFDTIKQALLKAQEPKQYLKWEDLKKLGKEIKVKLNGVEYLLCKKIVSGFPEYYLYPEGNQKPVLMCLGDSAYEKQFFNALHLEVLENE